MNDKLERILKFIDAVRKDENDDLKELITDFPEADQIIKYIEAYEKKIAKLLKDEKKFFVQAIQQYLQSGSTDNILVQAVVDMVASDMFAADTFGASMSTESKVFLTSVCQEFTAKVMESIDADVPFEVLSKRTTDWIDNWSEDLGKLMKLTSHDAVQKCISEGIQQGHGIDKIVQEMKDLPQFDRKRARMTAITEVLTACTVSQNEAYMQSPAVTGKTWLHSGGKKNDPRPHHIDLHDVTVDKDKKFTINSPKGEFTCDHPRDTSLPGSERIRCHCALAPNVDESILLLSKEEKQAIREEVLRELGKV